MEHWADPQLCTQGTVQCDTVGVSLPQLSIHSTVQCDTVGVSSPQLSIHSTVQCDAVGVSSPQLCIRNRGHSSVMRWVWARHSSAYVTEGTTVWRGGCELATALHAHTVQCGVTWWAWACAPSTGSTHNRHSKNTQWCVTARSRIAQSYNSAPEVPRLAGFLLLVFNLVTALNSLKNFKLSNSSASCQNRWWETKS